MVSLIFAYFGPETTLPFASGIVMVIGFVIMVGRNGLNYLGRKLRRALRFGKEPEVVGRASRNLESPLADEPTTADADLEAK